MEETKQEAVQITLEEAKELLLLDQRHTIIFNDTIKTDTVNDFINELSNFTLVDIFFSTEGGEMSAMNALLQYLNKRKDDFKIILTDEICSAGTFILTDFEGEIEISRGLDFILFHLIDRIMYTKRVGEISKIQLAKQLKDLNQELAEKYSKLGLSSKEISRFKSGRDVILYRKDFHRLNINKDE